MKENIEELTCTLIASIQLKLGKFLSPVKQLYFSSFRDNGLSLSIINVTESNPERTDFFSN